MASALESKRSRTCCRTSAELVHPIRGSIALGDACSKSSTHDLVWAMERMAFLAGPYMRAVVMLLATLKGRRRFIASPSPRRCVVWPSADEAQRLRELQELDYSAF